MTELTWKDSGINTVAKMKGKKVGNWLFGNEFELFAALSRAGMDPAHNKGVTIVKQPFDMNLFMKRQIDAASAMTYNELAQVLETKNPATGKLYTLKDLNVFKYSDVGTGMLQDGIFVKGDWIKNKANQATAIKFLGASFAGWIWCRDHYKECVNIVLQQGTALGRGHQTWQMNEVNKLIWPSKRGIGIMDPAAFALTSAISLKYGVIKKKPAPGAYVTTYAKAALAGLKSAGYDVYGKNYKPALVTLKEGGK